MFNVYKGVFARVIAITIAVVAVVACAAGYFLRSLF